MFSFWHKNQDEDRKSLLRKLSDEQYKDVIRVLAMLPVLEVGTNTEVVDDEEQHVVTAGAIVTVTVTLERKYDYSKHISMILIYNLDTYLFRTMDSLADLPLDDLEDDKEDKEIEELDSDIVELTHEGENSEAAAITAEETEKKKTPLWRPKPQKGKKGKKGVGGGKQKAKNAKKKDAKSAGDTAEDSTNAASNMDNQAVSQAILFTLHSWHIRALSLCQLYLSYHPPRLVNCQLVIMQIWNPTKGKY